MADAPTAVAVVAGIPFLVVGGRILARAVRNWIARLHAIRSIPLPRHSTLISGKPSGHIEAVLLDVFDTEHRRRLDGDPKYYRYSAQEVAELRVFLFNRAFRRKEPRILYEIEVGVPLLRKLEERDEEICAWALEHIKANPPLFGKPDTIDDLILKPARFRSFLWTHGIGSSAVLFFERVFRELPITIVPRGLLPASERHPVTHANSIETTAARAKDSEHDDETIRNLVTTHAQGLLKDSENWAQDRAPSHLSDTRKAVLEASPQPPPAVVRDFVGRLDIYEQRLASFEGAFEAETSKPDNDWAQWLKAAATEAASSDEADGVGDDTVLEVFKRHARRIWVTSTEDVTVGQDSSAGARHRRSEAPPKDDNKPTIETFGEVMDEAPTSPIRSSEHNADKGSEIGF